MEAELGHFSVTCMFKNVEDGFLWAFTGVYGPVKRCKRELFWEELGDCGRGPGALVVTSIWFFPPMTEIRIVGYRTL